MTAAVLPLRVEQGSDLQIVVTIVGGPADLTGYVGKMQIREHTWSPTPLYSTSGNVTVDAANRQLIVELKAADTAPFTWREGVYDVLLTSPDGLDAYRVAEGRVVVSRSVTRGT